MWISVFKSASGIAVECQESIRRRKVLPNHSNYKRMFTHTRHHRFSLNILKRDKIPYDRIRPNEWTKIRPNEWREYLQKHSKYFNNILKMIQHSPITSRNYRKASKSHSPIGEEKNQYTKKIWANLLKTIQICKLIIS